MFLSAFRFRYPRGESYLDVIHRLEPVIFELERLRMPAVVVCHRAVMRCLMSYFLDLPHDEIPHLEIPMFVHYSNVHEGNFFISSAHVQFTLSLVSANPPRIMPPGTR